MRSSMRLLLLAFLGIYGLGCASLGVQPARPVAAAKELDGLTGYFNEAAVGTCAGEADAKTARNCRDSFVYGRIHAYDLELTLFEDKITKLSQDYHLIGDLLLGGLSGAGTVVKGAQTKSIVAALATLVTGAKSSADSDLFFQKSVSALVNRMEALRKQALLPIQAGLVKDATLYPLRQALLDVEDYYKAVNLMQAVASIDQDSKQMDSAATSQKNAMLNLTFGDDQNSTLLRNYWAPNGVLNKDHEKALNDWLSKNVTSPPDIASFIHGSIYTTSRAKAVAEVVNKTP